MREYIEDRVYEIAAYIVETGSTVRACAGKFGVSKSTVHIEVTIRNDGFGQYNKLFLLNYMNDNIL